MSLIKSIKQQLGLGPAAENHFWDGSVANQLSLKRGTPDAPGATVMQVVDGVLQPVQTGPAFSAYPNAQAAAGNFTFANYTEVFDPNNCFDPTTGKFTPNVPGYYFFTGAVQIDTAVSTRAYLTKNQAAIWYGNTSGATSIATTVSALIYCNGTTDYVQMGIASPVSWTISTGEGITYFQGFMARKA